ncbi:hypothetical protein PR002_g22063 [Phytophthora rubi]|uniref:Uncharacterized protein n=1 Tax=Phytophthora rubi TaxID=129364 RepID=A0A6A3IZ25_9STRA|nr:hypothetical protein PR002_g22063 [Phytophthora rubi]
MVFTPSDDEKTLVHAVNERSNAESRSSTEAKNPVSSTSTARIPQPIFAFVMPPKVSSIARDKLVEWLKLRKEYEETMKERCKDGNQDIGTVMKSVKNAFDEYLLGRCANYQNQVLPPVNELFQKELRMDMNNMDITSRVTSYFMSCNTLIKKYGFTSFFEEEHGSKKKCKLIVNSLPAALKEKVKNEIDYRFLEAQSNVMKLYKLICQQALEEAIEHRALNRERKLIHKQKQREQPHLFQKNKRQNTGQQQKVDTYQKKGGKVVQPAAESPVTRKSNPGRKKRRRLVVFTVEGPIISVDAQPQTRKTVTDLPAPSRTREAESTPRGGTANLRKLKEYLPTPTRSLVLEDAFTVVFCADSGADRSGMSMEIYERFVKACPEAAKAVRLEKPLVCKGADGEPIEVKLIVNLHLNLTTAAGSVRIAKPVECLIIPGDSTEFLLGNDVLNMLGIDVSRQLDLLVANAMRD